MSRKGSDKKKNKATGKEFNYEMATGMGLDTATPGTGPAVTKRNKGQATKTKGK